MTESGPVFHAGPLFSVNVLLYYGRDVACYISTAATAILLKQHQTGMIGQRSIAAWVGCLVLALILEVAVAQDAVDPAESFVQGVAALGQNRAGEAVALLAPLFASQPAYIHPGQGTVAYWLGRAYETEGQSDQALATWEAGYRALRDQGLADMYLSDALVRAIYRRGDTARYALGADAYLNLLAYLDTRPTGALWDLLAHHLAALVFILPEEALQATGLTRERLRTASIQAGAGSYLVRWWRSQDTLPATRENERLHEHLARVAYATEQYVYNGDPDDRAAIYIRLGTPYHATTIDFSSTEFQNKVLRRVPNVTVFSFPENEYWVYKQIDATAQYLFVKKQGQPFRLGTPNDLIPETLRMGSGGTRRGIDKAEALVWTMAEMYRQLAVHHPAFLSRYNDAADYAEQLDNLEFLGELDRRSAAMRANRTADATRNQGGNTEAREQARRLGLTILPDIFAQNMMMAADADDNMAAHDRAERVPTSYANLLGNAEPMDMHVRVARFLEPNGTTRAEIYWSTSAENLRPAAPVSSSPYFLSLSTVQKAADFQDQAIQQGGHLIDPDFLQDGTQVLTPQQEAMPGDTATFHLALQWDLYATQTTANGRLVRDGPPLKANVYRADTLAALSRDEGVLEMSDLKPMLLDADAATLADNLVDAATPYPFFGLENDTPLALYFELYHLAYGPDDRTHYDVAYEIKRRRPGSLLRLRRGHEDQIAVRTDVSGSSRTAQEFILLDLSAWEGTGEVEVTVRVTDTVTGQQAARSLFFELVGD